MILHIKNMVCDRCKMVVKSELEQLGLQLLSVELGMVETKNTIDENKKDEISKKLLALGFELLDDKKSRIIEKIKALLRDLTQNKNADLNQNLSAYIADNLNHDYSKLSNLFSEVEGISIEKYYIHLKIEKAKELVMYDELSLSEIADLLNYSSVAHLSNQFKKVTGFTPTHFKQIKAAKRIQIDKI